jgi:hypothetical protein
MVVQGLARLRRVLPGILEDVANERPALAQEVIAELQARRSDLDQRITSYDRRLALLARQSEAVQRLMQLEGVGAATATTMVATIGDGPACKAWPAVGGVAGACPPSICQWRQDALRPHQSAWACVSSHAADPRGTPCTSAQRHTHGCQEPLGRAVQATAGEQYGSGGARGQEYRRAA